jgi:hypothetical protein
MGSIVRGKINRGDMALWDGKNATSSRVDASGGTVSGLAINDFVDLLQVFGAGTAKTSGTANSAVGFVGTTTCTFMFAPGTWDFSADVTFPSTVTCYIAAGAVITPSAGITVTFSGPVIHEATTWTGGAGTVTTTLGQAGLIDIADAGSKYTATTVEAAFAELAATTGAGIIGLLDSGGNFTATTVEAALAELASVSAGEGASAGSFTGTLTGCTTSPTATFYYSVTSLGATYSEVKLWCPAGLSATSNSASVTVTGLPAAIQSASTQARANTHSIDNSNTIPSLITITAGASVLNFNVFTGTSYSSLAYTTSGTKGINTGWNLSYIID